MFSHNGFEHEIDRKAQVVIDGHPESTLTAAYRAVAIELYTSKPQDDIGIPNVPAMVHSAERFDGKAKLWAEQALPRILELADSASGGSDESLISELADTLKNFAESEIAWRNAGK